jgi:2-keto-4-pentenoate hydratase
MQPKSSTEILAERLRAAYTNGPITPMRDLLDTKDAASAFAVQLFNVNLWKQQGRRMTGRKIGLTSPAVQAQFGVDQPDYGVLFKDTEIEDGGNLDPRRVLQPRAEAEVAITLRRDIDNPDAGVQEVIAAIDCVLPSIEIVDSRIADWKISFADTVADNASSGFYVLGTVPRAITGLDLWTCGMVLEISGKVASVGAGAACLGHPLRAAAWLARTLSRLGEPLRAGEVILTGALGATVPLQPGSVISTTIGGIGSCRFTYRSES